MLRKLLRVSLCLLSPCFATAQTITEIAAQAAARISSLLPPRATVSFDYQNLSAVSVAASSAFRSALEAEMKKSGIEIPGTGQPEARIILAISENLHGVMIVGEVRTGERRQTIFLPWLPPQTAAPSARLKLDLKGVLEQPDPILDFALITAGSKLLVLGIGKISLYEMTDGRWKLSSSIALQLSRPLPRDPRGRLIAEQTVFRVWLPGTSCNGSAQPPLGANCVEGNEQWTNFRWAANRNYVEIAGMQGAFYTAAAFDAEGRYILAGLDGRVRDRTNEPVNGAGGWGSDVAGPFAACGSSSLVVGTKAGERDAPDSLEAYEMATGAAVPASEPMALSGPVTALWPGEDRDHVNVVVRNIRTGDYEASRVRLACTQ
jgi:hypothetical protein